MLRGARISYGWFICSLALVGCIPLAAPPTGDVEVSPDTDAIVAVVQDVYRRVQQPTAVFLGGSGIGDSTLGQARIRLESDLPAAIRSPAERVNGEPGASIALGRFTLERDGRLSVVASFVQEDGSGRGCTQYTLDREGDGWTISDAVDAWPACPISEQGTESYHTALQRIRSDECFGIWANIGMCGQWLYVGETSGFGGIESYYDSQTGLIIAQKTFTDVAGSERFVFGHVECEPVVTETVLCDR